MHTKKSMTNLTKSDQLKKANSTALYTPVDPAPLPPTRAALPRVSIGHNAAADTSPRQAKVNQEDDPNLHKEE